MGELRSRAWGHRAALTLALMALAGCRSSTSSITGVRVITLWGAGDVDQIELSIQESTGEVVLPSTRRPSSASGPLKSGTDVVIYLSDDLDGKMILCDVRGYRDGVPVGSGQRAAMIASRTVVEVMVALDKISGDAGTDDPMAPKPNGEACMMAAQCKSRLCVDGFCCETACAGSCQACNTPGKQGVCTFVPVGVKHKNDCADQGPASCGYDGTCDGKGACHSYAVGAPCSPGQCMGSTITSAGACDGKGKCTPGPTVVCAPFNCDATGAAPRCLNRCTSMADCVPGRPCESGSCGKKFDGATCTDSLECSSGFCTDGVCCETKCDGACLTCNQTGMPGMCRPVDPGVKDPRGQCKDEGAPTCGTTGACDGKGACARYPSGAVCKAASCMSATVLTTVGKCDGKGVCIAGVPLACSPFACMNGSCKGTCDTNADCALGRICDLPTKSCGKKGLGQACGDGGQCETGLCVDGVCCNETCDGACRSCSAGRAPGMCAIIAAGVADPRLICKDQGASTCGNDGTCNGAGACRRYAIGTVCGAGTCAIGFSTRTLPSTCDAAGKCAMGSAVTCAPFKCNGLTCFTACGSDNDCVAPNVCLGGTCGQRGTGAPCARQAECANPLTCIGSICRLRPQGNACAANNLCASGFCTEGVCCDAGDCGSCRSCKVAGFVGYCHALPAGSADPKGMCGKEDVSTCGKDGTCDGGGGCRLYAPGTECLAGRCSLTSARTRINPRICDGNGNCNANGNTDCNPYVCSGATGSCFSSCDMNSQCCCSRCRNNSCQ